ncbi:MAG: HNH endonuclease [Proteobacteria bacterium]|nr:HNH endonuclease [Pseudomonadota bacterium]
MAVTLARQISAEEKEIILNRFERKCYATGHDLPEGSEIHFDHIKAFSNKGASELDNIAPMCREHNLKKGTLSLHDFKIKLELEKFFNKGQALTLKDELKYFKDEGRISEYGKLCYFDIIDNNKVQIETDDKKTVHELFTCPVTNYKYFHTLISINSINSDDDEDGEIGLQPRYLIFEKVFNLYRHFQKNPVLQPSIARLHKNQILVFDGQHKIAALLWNERKEVELKIYIEPDAQLLNNTNIAAHDKFAQTRFFSSVMVSKLGSQFGKKFEEYKDKEDGIKKSECGFIQYLKYEEELTQGEASKKFTSFLSHMVIDNEQNKISKFISKGNRSSDAHPLTVDMLNKSIFSNFLYRKPLNDDMLSEQYKRENEINNVIELCNILYDEALYKWDPDKNYKNELHINLSRMFRSKSIMAWAEILRDGIIATLRIRDSEEQKVLFYRELTSQQFEDIRITVRRLVEWSLWSSPPDSAIDRVLADNKGEVKKFMGSNGLTASYLLGASS